MSKTTSSLILVYSYRNVFFDGSAKLHAAIRVENKLLVFTKTKPRMGKCLMLPQDFIKGPHFSKKPGPTFLTTAYNHGAKRYSNKAGGWVEISANRALQLEELFSVKINVLFNPQSKIDVMAALDF